MLARDNFKALPSVLLLLMFHRSLVSSIALAVLLGSSSFGQAPAPAPAQPDPAFPPQPPIQPLSAEEELKTIKLPPGYRLELVLSEPVIQEPAICVFDEDGRMFV